MIKSIAGGFADDEPRGEIKKMQDILIKILHKKFRKVPSDVENIIRKMTDSVALDSWAEYALDCYTMDEFTEAIR